MIRTLIALLVAACAYGQFAQNSAQSAVTTLWEGKAITEQRMVELASHFFLVEYTYTPGIGLVSVPATIPPGVPHYDATVSVFEIINGTKKQIGEAFAGQWAGGTCFEDRPESMVQQALKRTNGLTPEIEKEFAALQAKREWDAMPLYKADDDVIEITPKGVKELREVKIDGKVVWENPDPEKRKQTAGKNGTDITDYSGTISTGTVAGDVG